MTALMIESAARSLLFAVAVGAGLRLFRVSNVPVRKAAWSLVLVASLAMPFVMRAPAVANWKARWGWTVPVPSERVGATPTLNTASVAVRRSAVVPAALHADQISGADNAVSPVPVAVAATVDLSAAAPAPGGAVPSSARFQWPPAGHLMAMIYLGVAGALLLRLLWGLAMALRLWATADLVSPLTAPEPNVRSSGKITSPVTIGSGIVLPANYMEWDHRKLWMVLAHERSHVRQMDFYVQMLAGLYAAIFWFSPLGWWLRRTLAGLGEAIGDRAGLDAAASRSRYAEVLLEFASLPRQTLPGVAMAKHGNLSRRVDRLLNEHLFERAFAEGKRRAVVSLLLIPVGLFAATVLIRVPGARAQTAPQAPASPVRLAGPVPAAPASPADAPEAPALPAPPAGEPQVAIPPSGAQAPLPPTPGVPSPVVAPMPPTAQVPPVPAVAPVAPVPPDPDGLEVDDSADSVLANDDQAGQGYTYAFSDHGESWAIVEGTGGDVTFSGDWSGDRRAQIDAARKVAKGPFLWFTHEGKSYVVTDPAIIAKIRAMYKPMEDLGRRQEFLGKQQEALGKQMEEMSRQQEAAGAVKMPDLSKEIAEVDAAMAKLREQSAPALAEAEAKMRADKDKMLSPEKMAELQAKLAEAQEQWSSERMAAMQEKLGALQERLGELQGEAGAHQGDFGARMGELGAQQGRLGSEQGRLGAEQGRIARQADRQVREMIEQCLRDGTAKQVPQAK